MGSTSTSTSTTTSTATATATALTPALAPSEGTWKPEFKDEGPSRCTIDLEPVDRAVKLTITHEIDRPDSELIGAVSVAWPLALSNLKSLLEAGEVAVTSHPGH